MMMSWKLCHYGGYNIKTDRPLFSLCFTSVGFLANHNFNPFFPSLFRLIITTISFNHFTSYKQYRLINNLFKLLLVSYLINNHINSHSLNFLFYFQALTITLISFNFFFVLSTLHFSHPFTVRALLIARWQFCLVLTTKVVEQQNW